MSSEDIDFLIKSSTKKNDIKTISSKNSHSLLFFYFIFHLIYRFIFYAEQDVDSKAVFFLNDKHFMKPYTNIIMKIDMITGNQNLIALYLQILYFTTISYWTSLKSILSYLDEKKCHVKTYTKTIKKTGVFFLLVPILLSMFSSFFKMYSIALMMVSFIIWLIFLSMTLAPNSYNIMLQLNQLLFWIPLFIFITWFIETKLGFYAIKKSSATTPLKDTVYKIITYGFKYLLLSTIIKNIFMPTFTKEISYYCVNVKIPETDSNTVNMINKYIDNGYK